MAGMDLAFCSFSLNQSLLGVLAAIQAWQEPGELRDHWIFIPA